MYRGRRCGRLPYSAPAGVNERPVCLMHSRDPDKDYAEFQREFERILEEAGEGEADFTRFVFLAANYLGKEFNAQCIFREAKFTQWADFIEVTFVQGANFTGATFTQGAEFIGATFTQKANFVGAGFTQGANFGHAAFTQEADFGGATFTQEADFSGATFTQEANFGHAAFSGEATLWETTFRNDGEGVGPVFSQARFEKPERAVFYGNHLGQALFHNCDVSNFVFSNVEWRRRKNGKRMVFEEVVSLEGGAAVDLRLKEGSGDERNYGLIAELYQQLKKNFDDRRDYWTAGDFHWGEMEMKCLSSGRSNLVLRWLDCNLSLTALYKYASAYGESYGRPLAWLGFVLLVFTLAYPLAGLERAGGESEPVVSWAKMGQFFAERNYAWWSVPGFWLHGLLMAVSVMMLQRDLPYSPASSLGWWLRLAEYLLSVILIPLFLLALRRQFRR